MKLDQQGSRRVAEPRNEKNGKKKRFLIVKLEERIAPTCHTNPHGKQVGCGGGGHHSCYCF
jgi:hypothetical protein